MSIKVRVPATSANIGPGFDALGLALNLYNTLEVDEAPCGLELEITGEGEDSLSRDKSNLIVASMYRVFEQVGKTPPGLRIRAINRIPLARGLGSSAAAIVSGLVAANRLCEDALSMDQLLEIAADIEGHPDNVAPALLGGFVISTRESTKEGPRVRYMRLEPPLGSKVLVFIPDRELRTEEARAVLPRQVPLEDAVFNISRACALVGGLVTGQFDVLEWATEDRLHQQYRQKLAPELVDAIRSAREAGALGAVVSGSGPSLLIFPGSRGVAVKSAVLTVFAERGIPCRVLELSPDPYGARVSTSPNNRRIVIQKYGGSSVADPDKIKRVAARVADAYRRGDSVVVVVSAMGKTTDSLIQLAHSVSQSPRGRELDVLLSTGEQVSMALLCMALQDMGIPAISLTGSQVGIVTDATHTRARIIQVEREKLRRHLEEGRVVVVAGFQGVDRNGDITTLGRGGSDTTAVALAAALGAPECEIYTDVDGVFTADPRIEPSAELIPEISYDEMVEMAGLGAKVMQLRSVEFGRRYGVAIHVRNSMNDRTGTWIREVRPMEEPLVRAITHSADEVKIVLKGVPDVPGIAAKVFRALANENIRLDMIIQAMGTGQVNDIAFTVTREDFPAARIAAERVCAEVGGREVLCVDDIAKVSVVGAGITQDASVAADMFEALAAEGINIDMISTSGSRISCIICREKVREAVRALHRRFGLSSAVR